jgi:flagellar protein FliO/FliZ
MSSMPQIPLAARCRLIVALASACCAWPAWAAPAAATAPERSSFLGELLAILVPLALIIVALLLVLRLARRRYGLTGQDAPLSIVQILPVGPRERIVLVRARSGRVFTVGVGPQSVNFLTNLDPADLVSPGTAAETSDPAHIHTASGR